MLYTHDRAIILNDLANSYALEMRYSKAIARYKEALALYIALAKKEPLNYGIHIAHVFSNLSVIYFNLEKKREADAFHQHSLKMHRALVKNNLAKYGVGLACCLIEGVFYLNQHSLTLYEAEGVLYNVRGEEQAEQLLEAVWELRKRRVKG